MDTGERRSPLFHRDCRIAPCRKVCTESVRYLCGNLHPDHDTVCTFRVRNEEAISTAFLEVLKLAKSFGLLKVGMVSVDGTKIKANASIHKSLRYDRARELEQELERQADARAIQEKKSWVKAMADAIGTQRSRDLYKKRKCTVEPVFGIVKQAMGFRQFLRGLEKVNLEWPRACVPTI